MIQTRSGKAARDKRGENDAIFKPRWMCVGRGLAAVLLYMYTAAQELDSGAGRRHCARLSHFARSEALVGAQFMWIFGARICTACWRRTLSTELAECGLQRSSRDC